MRNRTFLNSSREEQLLIKYNLTEEAYNAIEETQSGKCKICGISKADTRYGVLDVDHDHSTGRIRGLLCNSCNRGLGLFKDNTTALLRAIQYLKGNI